MAQQITSTILMIRPVSFGYNEETASNNYYQKVIDGLSPDQVQARAESEFDDFVRVLRDAQVEVIVVDDTSPPDTPDSVFPNNWVSFHEDGRVGLYPMFAKSRRLERREDIVEEIIPAAGYQVTEVVDFSTAESEEKFLEGTGSLVLDRQNRIAYASLSDRTDENVLQDFCQTFAYEPVIFTSYQDVAGSREPIYHTNVMMCLADDYAILCGEAIDNETERKAVISRLELSGKEVILISEEQEHHFAGNMLQVKSTTGDKYLVMSSAAYHSLGRDQIAAIDKFNPILHSSLDTIEACGGGSARCMMAEIFLPKTVSA